MSFGVVKSTLSPRYARRTVQALSLIKKELKMKMNYRHLFTLALSINLFFIHASEAEKTKIDKTKSITLNSKAINILKLVNETLDPKREIRDSKNIILTSISENFQTKFEQRLIIEGKDKMVLIMNIYDKGTNKLKHGFTKICDGVNSWEIEQGNLREGKYDATDRKRYVTTILSMIGLINIDKIDKAELISDKEIVNKKNCYTLKVKENKSQSFTVFIDKQTHLIVKIKTVMGELIVDKYNTISSSKYISKASGGVLGPHSMRTLELHINNELPADTFLKPVIQNDNK